MKESESWQKYVKLPKAEKISKQKVINNTIVLVFIALLVLLALILW